jgi:hypothetical protein
LFEFVGQHLGRPVAGSGARVLEPARQAPPSALPRTPATVAVERPPMLPGSQSAFASLDVALLEARMVSFVADRLAVLGEAGSGLGAYYAARIRSGRAFGDADQMLVGLLASSFLDYDGIVEIGAGYGQLGLALGVLGRQVICIEVDRNRVACMEALKAHLAASYPQVAQNVMVRLGTWPAVLKNEDPSGALLVAVDFVYTGSGDIEAEAVTELLRYGGSIIDASHFVHSRLTPDARSGFYATLRRGGFADPEPLAPHANTRKSEFVFLKRT